MFLALLSKYEQLHVGISKSEPKGGYLNTPLNWPVSEIMTGEVRRNNVPGTFTEYTVEGQIYQLKQSYTSLRYNPRRYTEYFVTGAYFVPLGIVISEPKGGYYTQPPCPVGSKAWLNDPNR